MRLLINDISKFNEWYWSIKFLRCTSLVPCWIFFINKQASLPNLFRTFSPGYDALTHLSDRHLLFTSDPFLFLIILGSLPPRPADGQTHSALLRMVRILRLSLRYPRLFLLFVFLLSLDSSFPSLCPFSAYLHPPSRTMLNVDDLSPSPSQRHDALLSANNMHSTSKRNWLLGKLPNFENLSPNVRVDNSVSVPLFNLSFSIFLGSSIFTGSWFGSKWISNFVERCLGSIRSKNILLRRWPFNSELFLFLYN